MLKRSAILGLSLAAASLTAGAPAIAATAAPPHASTSTVTTTAREATAAPANCPAGDLCGYTSPNYVGSVAAGTEGELAGNNLNLNVANDVWNRVASIYNHGRTDNVRVYRGENYSSNTACLYKGTGFPNMASQLPNLYHHIWSNLWITSNCT